MYLCIILYIYIYIYIYINIIYLYIYVPFRSSLAGENKQLNKENLSHNETPMFWLLQSFLPQFKNLEDI